VGVPEDSAASMVRGIYTSGIASLRSTLGV
jgi:hypothetical protein